MLYQLSIQTSTREQVIDITDQVVELIPDEFSGVVVVYTPHTTCSITINEGYDPDVARDLLKYLSKLVPQSGDFKHLEWNSDAHIKSSLLGVSQTIIVQNWKLLLGRWQRIFFVEFDWPRTRQVFVKFIED